MEVPKSLSEHRNKIIIGSAIAIIIAASIGIVVLYVPAQNNSTASTNNGASNKLSIDYASLRASESGNFYPTLWSSLFVGSALSQLNASINGEQVYFQPLNQDNVTNFHEEVSTEIRNSNLNIIVGNSYSVSFTATFQGNKIETVSTAVVAFMASPSNITLSGVALCAANCVYPSPYLSAEVLVNASVPLSMIQVFVNGTSTTGQSYQDNNMTQYAVVFKGGTGNLAIVAGQTYNVTFVGAFADGSRSTASSTIVAY